MEYVDFNDAPIYSVVVWGDGIKFLKLSNAVPKVKLNKQRPNSFNLNNGHYCVIGADFKVKVIKQLEDFDDTDLIIV